MAREDIRIIYICKRCLNEDQRIIEINETEEEQYSYPHKCCSFCHSQDYVRTSYIFDVEGKFYHHKDYKNVKTLVKSLRRQPEFNRELYNKRNENNKTISKSDSLRFWIGSLIMCLGIIAAVICGLTIGKGGMGISLLIAIGGAFCQYQQKLQMKLRSIINKLLLRIVVQFQLLPNPSAPLVAPPTSKIFRPLIVLCLLVCLDWRAARSVRRRNVRIAVISGDTVCFLQFHIGCLAIATKL